MSVSSCFNAPYYGAAEFSVPSFFGLIIGLSSGMILSQCWVRIFKLSRGAFWREKRS